MRRCFMSARKCAMVRDAGRPDHAGGRIAFYGDFILGDRSCQLPRSTQSIRRAMHPCSRDPVFPDRELKYGKPALDGALRSIRRSTRRAVRDSFAGCPRKAMSPWVRLFRSLCYQAGSLEVGGGAISTTTIPGSEVRDAWNGLNRTRPEVAHPPF